jgi:shikimate kinase
MTPRIILIGPMGAGKSTAGAILASAFSTQWRDTDLMITAQSGREISDIFTEDGEDAFRAIEKIVLRTALLEDATVLSLGGGACLSVDSQSALRVSGSFIAYLKISLAEVSSRVGFNRDRPLLLGSPRAQWQALMNDRAPIYESLADIVVEVDGKSPEEIAEEISLEYRLHAKELKDE